MDFPLPGSPGVATMGAISRASSSITCAYSAPASLASPRILSAASRRLMPRRSMRNSTTLSSGGHDSGEPADFGRHIGHGGALVDAERFHRFPGILHHLGQGLAA